MAMIILIVAIGLASLAGAMGMLNMENAIPAGLIAFLVLWRAGIGCLVQCLSLREKRVVLLQFRLRRLEWQAYLDMLLGCIVTATLLWLSQMA